MKKQIEVFPHHDARPGPLRRCQITDADDLFQIIDLGHQPPCDALLGPDDLDQPEMTYPLRLNLSPSSGLAQLDYSLPGDLLYPESYPYRSGISKPLAEYQRAFADRVCERFAGTSPNPLVVDVGSNDGTLLTGFKRRGMRALGIEPTDVAQIAVEENGIATRQTFFTQEVAREIAQEYGLARIITMTNVFAHMPDLGEVMRGICSLLARDGVFISESHYLLDVLEKLQFDTIYHEHLRTYSLRSLCLLAEMYGMEVFDVERGSRYGGNIRVYISWKGAHPSSSAVGRMLEEEEEKGLFDPQAWVRWRWSVLENRDRTLEFLFSLRDQEVVGCSAPGRASTLLNFYGLKSDSVGYLGELHNSLKLGKFTPGSHIPILSNRLFHERPPSHIILFAWHYGIEIHRRLRAEGIRSTLVVPLPDVQIFPFGAEVP